MFSGERRKSSLVEAPAATNQTSQTIGQQQQVAADEQAEDSLRQREFQLQQRRPLGARKHSATSFDRHQIGGEAEAEAEAEAEEEQEEEEEEEEEEVEEEEDEEEEEEEEDASTTKTTSSSAIDGIKRAGGRSNDDDERQRFLKERRKANNKAKQSPPTKSKFAPAFSGGGGGNRRKRASSKRKLTKAKLAKEESLEADRSCVSMLLRPLKQKRVFIPLLFVLSVVAVYCIPFVEIEPRSQRRLPQVPFNYANGPLGASSASAFKVEHLFYDQLHGPESGAIDSAGNMYLAVEGGFILYAHLNKRSQPIRAYYEPTTSSASQGQLSAASEYPELVKIAELNGIRQLPSGGNGQRRERGARDAASGQEAAAAAHLSWRRECQLDEQVYGFGMVSGGVPPFHSPAAAAAAASGQPNGAAASEKPEDNPSRFVSKVKLSRCSKPLGVRLSPDESYLYVIDTLSGLYRINLRLSERPHTTQRLVSKLIDFKANRHQLLPIVQLEMANGNGNLVDSPSSQVGRSRSAHLNITLMALDDLVVDYGAGSGGGDLIYMTDASQKWIAVSYFYDMLEAEGTGVVLRFDTGSNQLGVMNPSRVNHVRELNLDSQTAAATTTTTLTNGSSNTLLHNNTTAAPSEYLGIGAPKLDQDDIFDDRPLHFPNGLELTDDKQAILIADTTNKRIIKHYIRGIRKGTSDLWAWTPNFPDNIRRGHGQTETYWVIGCGQDTRGTIDLLDILHSWPMVRKLMLKNVYLFGWVIENIGAHLLNSVSVRDFGYSFRTGSTICERVCPGMMIVQYNKYGDIIRSIYSSEFPSDLVYYSQVSEFIDANNQEHILYLSSPSYNYLTKLTLPSNSFSHPS